MPSWEEIQKEWESTKITLAALAEKHDVKLGTLKSRKSREAWVRGPSKKDATKKKKDATISKRMQPKKAIVESGDLTDKVQRVGADEKTDILLLVDRSRKLH